METYARDTPTGRFTSSAQHAPEIADFAAPAASAPDRLSAEIVARCPQASSWALTPSRGRTSTVRVTFPSGGSIQLEAHPLDEPQLANLIAEAEYEGGPNVVMDLRAFASGTRQPAFSGPAMPVAAQSWKDHLTAGIKRAHPDLLALTISTTLYDNGFFWSTVGRGRAAKGQYRDVDLRAYDDLLVEAAQGARLQDYSLVTLDLRSRVVPGP
jgi:hypothetical protein